MKKTLIAMAFFASFAAQAETEMTVTTLGNHIIHGVNDRGELNPLPTAQFKAKNIIRVEDIFKNRVYKSIEDEKMDTVISKMTTAIHITMETSASAEAILIQSSIGKLLYSFDGAGYQAIKDEEMTHTGQAEIKLPNDGKPHNLNVIIQYDNLGLGREPKDIMVKILNGDSKAITWPYQISSGEKGRVDTVGYEYGYIKQTYSDKPNNTYSNITYSLPQDETKASFATIETTKTIMNQGLNLMESDLNGMHDTKTGHWLDFGLVVETPGIVRLLTSRSGAQGSQRDFSEAGSFYITNDKIRGVYARLQSMPFGDNASNGRVHFFHATKPGIYAMRFKPDSRVSKLQVIMPGESVARPFKPEDTVIKAKAANTVFKAAEATAGGARVPGMYVLNTPVEAVKKGAFSIGANLDAHEDKAATEIKGFYPPKTNEVLP